MPSGFIIYVIAIIAVGVGIYLFTEVYLKRPKKTDFSDILKHENVKYHGGGGSEIMDITDDLDLYHAVFMWCLPDESDYSKALEQVMGYNPGKRAIYLVNTLDYEVCNGGFNQYFYNKGLALVRETIRSLRHIDQSERADLLEKALENFQYLEESHASAHSAGSAQAQLEAFSKTYKDNPLGSLDDRYYYAGPDMWKILAQYIRTHSDEFKN